MKAAARGGYSLDDLYAAARTGYSRGMSDRKRGPRPTEGKVVVLSEWLDDRADRPDGANPGEWAPSGA